MPVAVSYPGVYVEEIPSGVRTITGVATSITAFIGSAARGPTNSAITINNFGDFENIFGGLWIESSLGFAVRDFFLNGGGQAIIVRLYHAVPAPVPPANPAPVPPANPAPVPPANPAPVPPANPAAVPPANPAAVLPANPAAVLPVNPAPVAPVNLPKPKAPLEIGALKFIAASEGRWGINLRASIATDNISSDIAKALGVSTTDLFHLTVVDTSPGGKSERFQNVTMKNSARQIDRVLLSGSDLLRYDGIPDATAAIAAGVDKLSEVENTFLAAKSDLVNKQNEDSSADVSKEKQAVADAKTALDKALSEAGNAVSNGQPLKILDFLPPNGESLKLGLYALEQADLFNLLCIPPYRTALPDSVDVDVNLIAAAAAYCEKRRAMLIVDSPGDWRTKKDARDQFMDTDDKIGTRSRNAALFFPRLKQPNPLRDNQIEIFAACGTVAGIFARTDTQRGVWKAPAGLDATLVGSPSLSVSLTDPENGELNQLGINCLRAFSTGGRVVWGSRTLRGADQLADEYKYIPVRRTALYIEESLFRGLKWVVFEPNDEPLWSQIRLNVGAFMHNLFRQGAFQGSSSKDAYFVKCDKETTTQNDINLGIVNVVVGFAPLKPAEFVIIKLQQMAGQIEV